MGTITHRVKYNRRTHTCRPPGRVDRWVNSIYAGSVWQCDCGAEFKLREPGVYEIVTRRSGGYFEPLAVVAIKRSQWLPYSYNYGFDSFELHGEDAEEVLELLGAA